MVKSIRSKTARVTAPKTPRDKEIARLTKLRTDAILALNRGDTGAQDWLDEANAALKKLDALPAADGTERNAFETGPLAGVPNFAVDAAVDQHRSNGHAKRNGKHPPEAQPLAQNRAPGEAAVNTVELPLEEIAESPDNARRTFDQAKLERLAVDLKERGQLMPCKVRQLGPLRYELIDGARRFRAAKLAGKRTLRCECAEQRYEDAAAREDSLMANLLREDLNPIERAIGLQQMLDDGRTQEYVARKLGITQPEVSNHVRLLKLPQEIKDKVVDGSISGTHAIALVPHVQRPAFVKALLKVGNEQEWDLGSVRDLSTFLDSVYRAVPHNGVYYDQEALAREHAEAIDLVVLKASYGESLFAMNTAVWKKVKAAEEKRKNAERDTAAKKPAKSKGKQGSSTKLTAGKGGAKEQGPDATPAVLKAHLVRWYAGQLATVLRQAPGETFGAKCLVVMALNCESWFGEEGRLAAAAAAVKHKFPPKLKGASRERAAWHGIAAVPREKWWKLVAESLAIALEQMQPCDILADVALLRDIATTAKIDLAKEWTVTKEFLDLHSIDQLAALAVEWGLRKKGDAALLTQMKHSAIVAELLDQAKHKKLACPEALLVLAKKAK